MGAHGGDPPIIQVLSSDDLSASSADSNSSGTPLLPIQPRLDRSATVSARQSTGAMHDTPYSALSGDVDSPGVDGAPPAILAESHVELLSVGSSETSRDQQNVSDVSIREDVSLHDAAGNLSAQTPAAARAEPS